MLSLTPRFSEVPLGNLNARNRFSGFSGTVAKTAEAVTRACVGVYHPAKAGC
jgi:hypothetical protein